MCFHIVRKKIANFLKRRLCGTEPKCFSKHKFSFIFMDWFGCVARLQHLFFMIHLLVPWHPTRFIPFQQTQTSIRFAIASRNAIYFFFPFSPFLLLLPRVCAWVPFYIFCWLFRFRRATILFLFSLSVFVHIFFFFRFVIYFDIIICSLCKLHIGSEREIETNIES